MLGTGMMVPQPSRTLDLQRKEELILQKQIRQTTAKIKKNLPTLIEASPDFTKKLPYLPYLPDSVQGPGLGYPGLGPHHVYEEDEDGAADSLATDTDLPSLYSVPHKLRSESRCSSITFDLTDAEGYNRNRSKSRNRRNREKKEKEFKEESQANIFAREEQEAVARPAAARRDSYQAREEEDVLSKWSCRRCTLENPLQEAVCLACGGSRLSSIGDIEVPQIPPKNLVNLIHEDVENVEMERHIEEPNIVHTENLKWRCKICTLENEPFNYYCDACNSPSPRRDENRKNSEAGDVVANKNDNEELRLLVSKIVRYIGIACFCLILLCALCNMVTSILSLLRTLRPAQPDTAFSRRMDNLHTEPHLNNLHTEPHLNNLHAARVSADDEAKIRPETAGGATAASEAGESEPRDDIGNTTNDPELDIDNAANIAAGGDPDTAGSLVHKIFFEIFGVAPALLAVYWPLFLFLATRLSKVKLGPVVAVSPRVAQPM